MNKFVYGGYKDLRACKEYNERQDCCGDVFCFFAGGLLTKPAVIRITIDVTTSVAESIPSLSTDKLPAINPTAIFDADRIKLPHTLIHEVRFSIVSLFMVCET